MLESLYTRQVFSCEIWEVFKNTCFEEHLRERLLLNLSEILRFFMKGYQRNIQIEKPIFKMAMSITESNILNDKYVKTNNVKFVSSDILLSFLRPFSNYKKCICFISNVI